jgi:amino acid adenylation domain-containing protein
VEAQVLRTPNAIAVSCGEEKLTYFELNQQANQLARHLRSLGAGPEIPVALYLERSVKMVVAILGVLKSGSAYVPIDLAYPKDRAAFMLKDTGAPVLLTQEKFSSNLPSDNVRVLALDRDWQDIVSDGSGTNPLNLTHPEHIAYIIYTSGSTGTPKGVVVTHHNVVRLLERTRHWYGFHDEDVWPLFHSYAFDVSVWELWGSLFNGGRLVVVPYLVTRSPAEFYELLARERVTVLNQTPSAFRQLIWAEQTAPVKRELKLRYVICAGEALELQSLKPWFDLHGDEQPRIVNMYGITETTVHSTYRVIRKSDLESGAGSVIGVPIPDLQIYLVDEDLRRVPVGTPGEICVGGAGVARGYLNRPELTAQRFISDPFSSEPGARVYRSGDLAQVSPTGELEYLGRMDHQVKIRGFRVELGEIESALNRHPGIRESVVVAREGAGGDKRLVAYFVPVGEPPNITELRGTLGRSLPDYMIPAVFLPLKALPLTTNGKVDRRALPVPTGSRPDLATSYTAPQNPLEQALAAIWSEVLEVDRVGVHDNFFELGGDSIRCITILSRAEKLGIKLSLQQIFQYPTVAELAQGNGAVSVGPECKPTIPFSQLRPEDRAKLPEDVEDAYPIARLQLGMYFHNELNPESAMYHDVFSYVVQSAFSREKLQEAVARLVARHPILRTSFHIAGFSEPLQLVHRSACAQLTVDDFRDISETEQQSKVVQWVEAEKRRPFDRTAAPMVRFHALVWGDRAFQFIISFHHSCLDGWSLAAVVTEIFQDYCALLSGSGNTIPAPGTTYRDFVALEAQTVACEETRRFWANKLNGASLGLVPRWPKAMCAGGHEQSRGPEVVPAVLAGLKRLSARAGVPLKSVLLAAHQRVMSLLFGQTDVTTALIANGRPEQVDGERILGLFLNAVPVRLQLKGGSWLELVRQTFAAEQELLPYRRFPLAEVQKLTGGRPFETAFDFVHFHVLKQLEGQKDFSLREGHYFEANDMTLYTTFMLDVTSTQLELHIDYDPNVIARAQVEQITQYYDKTLQAMAAAPENRYETFNPLSEVETNRLLVEWNATQEPYPTACIHELFEEQAEKTPGAAAVVFENRRLSYRELNELADRLARQLRRAGACPGTLVGIFLDRSVEMVAGLLAVLKTGAAYVPLDPLYPAERLAFMLADSQVVAVLTQPGLLPSLPSTQSAILCTESHRTVAQVFQPAVSQAFQPAAAGSEQIPSLPLPVGEGDGRSANPDSRAYVIYTSGSTGKPKGVQISHRSVVNLLTSAGRTTGFGPADNFLAVTTLSFDIAGLELLMPLIFGAQVTIAPRPVTSDGTLLAKLVETSGATFMQATPATWRLLLESGWRGKRDLTILCGGEPLKSDLAEELQAHSRAVWNFYGPTETTIWSTAWKVASGEPVRIGRPLANTQVYLLDQNLQPLPVGGVGELLIGGDGVALGYLNQPDLTAEKFIANPFSAEPGRRLYRTGDLARWLPGGELECLGRVDFQVKVHGFRIEPGEIENALRQHHAIADALVATHEDPQGERRLIGYAVTRNGPPSSSGLRDFLKTKLPAYMVPAHFVFLKQWPLTPNGKVDRRRLPAPDAAAPLSRTFAVPRSHEERALADIWKEVLMLSQVGIADNFFDLGGDSLSATRAFARVNRFFGTSMSLRDMLEHPTIAELAGFVQKLQGTDIVRQASIPRLPRDFRPTAYPSM